MHVWCVRARLLACVQLGADLRGGDADRGRHRRRHNHRADAAGARARSHARSHEEVIEGL